MNNNEGVDRVKEALEQFDQAVRPVVNDVLGLAQKATSEALFTLQRTEKHVGGIAEAAIRLGTAQAELIAGNGPKPPKPTSK